MRVKHSLSTVCYLEDKDKILFIKFNKKWGEVYAPPGGKMEEKESPLECIKREFKEETGLELIDPILEGYSYWNYKDEDYGVIFIYKANKYFGNLSQSNEGNVFWIDKDKVSKIKQFPMNEKFTEFILEDKKFEGNFLLNEDNSVKEYSIIIFE